MEYIEPDSEYHVTGRKLSEPSRDRVVLAATILDKAWKKYAVQSRFGRRRPKQPKLGEGIHRRRKKKIRL
jgi:hypothetical protein